MALTFLGVTSFSQCGPEQWSLGQYELDKLSVPYCGAVTGLNTYIGSLTRGDAYSGDSNMFLVNWTVTDTNRQYPIVTLEYMGAKGGVLPATHVSSSNPVQSSSTATSSLIWPAVATQPATVEYYALTNTIKVWSTTSTTSTEPDDPDYITSVIKWSIFGEQPGSSMPDIVSWILNNAFVQGIVENVDAEEVVAGQYWLITKRKTRVLFPYAPPS